MKNFFKRLFRLIFGKKATTKSTIPTRSTVAPSEVGEPSVIVPKQEPVKVVTPTLISEDSSSSRKSADDFAMMFKGQEGHGIDVNDVQEVDLRKIGKPYIPWEPGSRESIRQRRVDKLSKFNNDFLNFIFSFPNLKTLKLPSWIDNEYLEEICNKILEYNLKHPDQQIVNSLDLSYVSVSSLPDSLFRIPLKEVVMGANDPLPDSQIHKLFHIPGIVKINFFVANSIKTLPSDLNKSSLEEVVIRDCVRLSDFEIKKLFQIPKLTKLSISNTNIKTLPDNLEASPLTEVSVGLNRQLDNKELHKLFKIPGLKKLDLTGSEIKSLPANLRPDLEIIGCDRLSNSPSDQRAEKLNSIRRLASQKM